MWGHEAAAFCGSINYTRTEDRKTDHDCPRKELAQDKQPFILEYMAHGGEHSDHPIPSEHDGQERPQ